MLTVTYYEASRFDRIMETEDYFKIHRFLEDAPEAVEFFDSRFETGRKMEEFLKTFYGDRVSVQDEDVEADNLCVEIDVDVFSHKTIEHIESFLRSTVPSFAAIIVLYRNIKSSDSGYLGQLVFNSEKMGVMSGIKQVFEASCGCCLRNQGSSVVYDDMTGS